MRTIPPPAAHPKVHRSALCPAARPLGFPRSPPPPQRRRRQGTLLRPIRCRR
jgi:hypothetical protein